MIEKLPEGMAVCRLEVLLMPNGEVLCLGKTVGWFDNLKKYLYHEEETPVVIKDIFNG